MGGACAPDNPNGGPIQGISCGIVCAEQTGASKNGGATFRRYRPCPATGHAGPGTSCQLSCEVCPAGIMFCYHLACHTFRHAASPGKHFVGVWHKYCNRSMLSHAVCHLCWFRIHGSMATRSSRVGCQYRFFIGRYGLVPPYAYLRWLTFS